MKKNWSGHVHWKNARIHQPSSEAAVVSLVKTALRNKQKVRAVGSAHSFSPLCQTDDLLISLDNYQGIISIDKAKKEVSVKAGTKLNTLNQLLHQEGLALANMGDIDVQSLAGALSTGTHGTGTSFGNLSTFITSIRFVNGLGEVKTCSKNESTSLFKAAQIALGSLGIITAITLKCVDTYCLELEIGADSLEQVLNQYTSINANNRNFEFYWFPNTDKVMTRTANISRQAPAHNPMKNFVQEVVLENALFKLACECSYYFPKTSNWISRFSANTIGEHSKRAYSHQVYTTARWVRFKEMEYNIPVTAYTEVKKEITKWINKHNKQVMFPLENRFVKGDDIYLSPAYQRDSAYIAVHIYNKKDHRYYFNHLEQIFKAHQGRPHWGKMHTLTKEELQERYPMFNVFNKIRKEQDPHAVFVSPYLASLFEG